MSDYNGIKFQWLGHDGFKIVSAEIKNASKNIIKIYIDPFQLSKKQQNANDADLLLISHNHFDHLSMDDLKHVISEKTSIVAAQECIEQLKGLSTSDVKGVKPGDRLTSRGIPIEVLPAYNTNKKFHPKEDAKVGFVFTINGLRVYHAGDTDIIEEMKSANPDFALVPVSGTYVMTAEEAAKAVNEKIKPKKIAIPMHYGTIVGSEVDAAKFKDLVRVCEVLVLVKE